MRSWPSVTPSEASPRRSLTSAALIHENFAKFAGYVAQRPSKSARNLRVSLKICVQKFASLPNKILGNAKREAQPAPLATQALPEPPEPRMRAAATGRGGGVRPRSTATSRPLPVCCDQHTGGRRDEGGREPQNTLLLGL